MTTGDRPRSSQPLIQDPRLAAELRRLRGKYHQPGEAVAEKLKWSPSKVSRIERARSGIRRSDLIAYLRAALVPEHEGRAVLALADTLATQVPEFPGGHFAPAVRADSVLDWAPTMVPWLLQTSDYTEAVLASRQDVLRLSPGQREDYASAVLAWQGLLETSVTLRAVLSEAVLYQLVGSDRVMRAQLEMLGRPAWHNVEVRVLPQDRSQVVGYSAFSYLEYASLAGVGGLPGVMVYALDTVMEIRVDQAVWQHKIVFDHLWAAADPPAQAVKQALADAWSG